MAKESKEHPNDVTPEPGDIYYTNEPGLYYVYSDKGVWEELVMTLSLKIKDS